MPSCSAVCGGAVNRNGGGGAGLTEADASTCVYCLPAAVVARMRGGRGAGASLAAVGGVGVGRGGWKRALEFLLDEEARE
jgi:hypothetical protein